LDHCYAIKEEKVHFDLTGINENVKIAITPLIKKRQSPLYPHEYLINLLASVQKSIIQTNGLDKALAAHPILSVDRLPFPCVFLTKITDEQVYIVFCVLHLLEQQRYFP
jgi:hypothetical protein